MGFFEKNKELSRVVKCEKMHEGATKEEKRSLENALLKPETILPYTGVMPKHTNPLKGRSALIVFSSEKQKRLIGEIFSIRESVSGVVYITDVSLLEWVATQVKLGVMCVSDGSIVYAYDEDDLTHTELHKAFTYKDGDLLHKLSTGKRKKGSSLYT